MAKGCCRFFAGLSNQIKWTPSQTFRATRQRFKLEHIKWSNHKTMLLLIMFFFCIRKITKKKIKQTIRQRENGDENVPEYTRSIWIHVNWQEYKKWCFLDRFRYYFVIKYSRYGFLQFPNMCTLKIALKVDEFFEWMNIYEIFSRAGILKTKSWDQSNGIQHDVECENKKTRKKEEKKKQKKRKSGKKWSGICHVHFSEGAIEWAEKGQTKTSI